MDVPQQVDVAPATPSTGAGWPHLPLLSILKEFYSILLSAKHAWAKVMSMSSVVPLGLLSLHPVQMWLNSFLLDAKQHLETPHIFLRNLP